MNSRDVKIHREPVENRFKYVTIQIRSRCQTSRDTIMDNFRSLYECIVFRTV